MELENKPKEAVTETHNILSLEEQVALLSAKVDAMTVVVAKVKRQLSYMIWAGLLKALLIIVPLVVGLIFLPPLLGPALGQYAELLGGTSPSSSSPGFSFETIKSLLSPQ